MLSCYPHDLIEKQRITKIIRINITNNTAKSIQLYIHYIDSIIPLRQKTVKCYKLLIQYSPQPSLTSPIFLSCPQDVIKLETQYWTLVDIPRQEKQETVPAFVLRACTIMEKSHKSGEGVKTSARLAEEAESKRERIERLESTYFTSEGPWSIERRELFE